MPECRWVARPEMAFALSEVPVTASESDPAEPPSDVWIDGTSERGYARSEGLQRQFDAAAGHLLVVDGWVDPLDPAQR